MLARRAERISVSIRGFPANFLAMAKYRSGDEADHSLRPIECRMALVWRETTPVPGSVTTGMPIHSASHDVSPPQNGNGSRAISTSPYCAVQLLMLTGQRRGEVAAMAWADIDLGKAVWTIPADKTKNAKPHAVPLSTTAVAIIAALPRSVGSPFVFPARGKPQKSYSGYSKGKRELDAAAKLKDWTLHELQRTAATGMARLGVAPHVVERVLNHVSGTFAGVAGVYNRFRYEDEMRDALGQWEKYLLAIIGTPVNASATVS